MPRKMEFKLIWNGTMKEKLPIWLIFGVPWYLEVSDFGLWSLASLISYVARTRTSDWF